MEQICVYHFKPMKLKAFLFAFWLSFGSASTGNFVQKFISKQEESQKKKKAIRVREKGERGHTLGLHCASFKKSEKGFKIFEESSLCHYPFSVHFFLV